MTIRQIQQIVADTTTQLLSITNDISYLISLYGKIEWSTCNLKRNILQERCDHLHTILTDMQSELDDYNTDGLSTEQQNSIALTKQLLTQNILILTQRQTLLSDLETNTKDIRQKLKTAQTIKTQTLLVNLQKRLQKEL